MVKKQVCCGSCVHFRIVSEMMHYRCNQGKSGGLTGVPPRCHDQLCELWKPSKRCVRVWIARENEID